MIIKWGVVWRRSVIISSEKSCSFASIYLLATRYFGTARCPLFAPWAADNAIDVVHAAVDTWYSMHLNVAPHFAQSAGLAGSFGPSLQAVGRRKLRSSGDNSLF